jgi:HK97 family phage portal protein
MAEKKGLLLRVWNAIWDKRGISDPGGALYHSIFDGIGITSESGELVTVKRGTKTATAYACINVLAQDVAKLPYNVHKDTEDGKVSVKNHPAYRVIHTRANSYTSAFNFWYKAIWDMFSHGNSYALINKGVNGFVKEIIGIQPEDVKVVLLNNEVFYKWNDIMFSSREILHFKIYSFDGILGVSPIIYNAESFGYRIKQDKYKAKVLGSKPPGVLTFANELTDTQVNDNREAWKRMTQGADIGGTPVLSGGAKYQPFMISPNEGQMIEASKLNREEICGIFRMPPTMIQDYERATFSNAEQQDLVYMKKTLTPILRVIEQECDYKLFSERSDLYTKFNIKGELRGDIKTQAEWYKMLRTYGLASANEIRSMEDLPKLEGEEGDLVLVQGAMMPLKLAEEFYKGKSETPSAGEDRQLGFDLEKIKEGLERLEIQNNGS